MEENQDLPGENRFSDDPEENLKLENQFLQLKLMAERGAVFGGADNEVPPDLMNQWLKNISAFEEQWEKTEDKPLREILGSPEFKPSADMDDEGFELAYKELWNLLGSHNVEVSFQRDRDDRFKYDFITGELLDKPATIYPGMCTAFVYEEFHPDHELYIQTKAQDFLNYYLAGELPHFSDYLLSPMFIRPDGEVKTREELIVEISELYNMVEKFRDVSFKITGTDFTLNPPSGGDDSQTGMAYCEGEVSYRIYLKNGKIKPMHGPFKIYFELEHEWWTIYFFYLIGFNIFPGRDESLNS